MATRHKYLVEVFWNDEDNGYIAVAPDLPGCSAFGDTATEAMREMQDAMDSWLEACASMGRPLPEPKAKPSHHEQLSDAHKKEDR